MSSFRPSFRKEHKNECNELESNFQYITNQVANTTESTQYKTQQEARIKCDACAGLDAALEQRSTTGRHKKATASRFLSSNEKRYNVN